MFKEIYSFLILSDQKGQQAVQARKGSVTHPLQFHFLCCSAFKGCGTELNQSPVEAYC